MESSATEECRNLSRRINKESKYRRGKKFLNRTGKLVAISYSCKSSNLFVNLEAKVFYYCLRL